MSGLDSFILGVAALLIGFLAFASTDWVAR